VGKIFPALVKSGGRYGNTAPLILNLSLKLIVVCIVSFRPRLLSPEEKAYGTDEIRELNQIYAILSRLII
jgi:hypothetical protein